MWAVIKKEFKSYFYSPVGYVFIGLFLIMFSIFFYVDVFNYQLWDYTMYTYNYRGVIALEIYLLWFFLGFFYALFCFKYVLKFKKLFDETIYEKLNKKKFLLVLISLVWIIYIGDIFLSEIYAIIYIRYIIGKKILLIKVLNITHGINM